MANGNEATKAAADYVTDAVDEDGISKALHKFVL
ncbi:MAG: HAD hydrolase family protein [Bacteroidales bacterium]